MKKLAQGEIGTGTGTLAYTVPTGFKANVMDICLANTTSGALTLALHFVPSGIAVGPSNMVFPTVSIPANTLVQWTGVQALNVGDFIQAIGSSSGLTMNISGDEYRA